MYIDIINIIITFRGDVNLLYTCIVRTVLNWSAFSDLNMMQVCTEILCESSRNVKVIFSFCLSPRPLSVKVQSRHWDKMYIETSSKCCLIPNQKYSLCCQPEECEVQPEVTIFIE